MNLHRADKLFLLTWRKLLLIPGTWLLCVLLHNAFYALLQPWFGPGVDEPLFFVLAVFVIPAYAVACVVYSLVRVSAKLAARRRNRARE